MRSLGPTLALVALTAVAPWRTAAPCAAREGGFVRARERFVAAGAGFRAEVSRGGLAFEQGPSAPRLVVRTSRIARGGVALSLGAADVRAEGGGGAAIARGEVVERFRADARGVEQAWHFARAPAGHGPLTVRVAVEGRRFAGVDAAGLHFASASASGAVATRYGHGTWIDATGARTPVPARFAGGEIVLDVPGDVVSGSRYPCVLDPVVSPEVLLAPLSRSVQTSVAVAAGAGGYLAVWEEDRAGTTGADVVAVAFARGGGGGPEFTPPGGSGFAIAASPTPEALPDVAFSGAPAGDSCLVVWQHGPTTSRDIVARFVSISGAMGGPPFVVSTADGMTGVPGDQSQPAVACDPGAGTCVVAWVDRNTDLAGDVRVARVTGGRVVEAFGGAVAASGPEAQTGPAVAFDGTSYLVAWNESTATPGAGVVRARRFAPTGVFLDSPPLTVGRTGGAPPPVALSAVRGENTVTWTDTFTSTSTAFLRAIDFRRSPPFGPAVPLTPLDVTSRHPASAFDGAETLVVYEQRASSGTVEDVLARRFTSGGAVLDPSPFAVSAQPPPEITPDVASARAGEFAVVYTTGTRAAVRFVDPAATTVACRSDVECPPPRPCVEFRCVAGRCAGVVSEGCDPDAGLADARADGAADATSDARDAATDAALADAREPDAALDAPGDSPATSDVAPADADDPGATDDGRLPPVRLAYRGGACACRAAAPPSPPRSAAAVACSVALALALALARRARRRRDRAQDRFSSARASSSGAR